MAPLPREVRTWPTEAWFRDVPMAEIADALPFPGVPLASVNRFLRSLATSPHAEGFGRISESASSTPTPGTWSRATTA